MHASRNPVFLMPEINCTAPHIEPLQKCKISNSKCNFGRCSTCRKGEKRIRKAAKSNNPWHEWLPAAKRCLQRCAALLRERVALSLLRRAAQRFVLQKDWRSAPPPARPRYNALHGEAVSSDAPHKHGRAIMRKCYSLEFETTHRPYGWSIQLAR